MRNWITAACLSILTSMISAPVLAEVVVIAHPENSTASLSVDEASKIFLGKTSRFPNGEQAVPLDQAEGNEVRDQFYSKVTKKTASQLNAYWSRLIFTGKGQPPKAVEDDLEVVDLVAENPNIIGYVSGEAVTEDVKVLLTVP